MAVFLAVLCGLAGLAGYYLGARRGMAWGKPVLVVGCLLAVLIVVADAVNLRQRIQRWTFRPPPPRDEAAETLGRVLQGHVADGDTVVFFRRGRFAGGPPGGRAGGRDGDWRARRDTTQRDAFVRGAGVDVTLAYVDLPAVPPGTPEQPPCTAEQISEGLAEHPRAVAWACTAGLPRDEDGECDLESVEFPDEDAPIPGAVSIADTAELSEDDIDYLRGYIDDGLLVGVALGNPNAEWAAVTDSSELPDAEDE